MSSFDSFWNGATSRHTAASIFIESGLVFTSLGGSRCFNSSDCAAGWRCSGGQCVPVVSIGAADGTTSSCGNGEGGGGCDVTVTRGMTAGEAASKNYSWAGGIGTKGFNWQPVYAPDGCTVTGCSLAECGGGFETDCPGERQCRYDAYGTVNCYCGEPEQTGCSTFCTSYNKSNGTDADGCSGLACDECSYCEEINVAATGNCKPWSGGPCHCNPKNVPTCQKCAEDGQTLVDGHNCMLCTTIPNYECSCTKEYLTMECCYSQSDWEVTNTSLDCLAALKKECDSRCKDGGDLPPPGPCAGDCNTATLCYPSGNPEDGPPDISGSHPGYKIGQNLGYVKNDETGEVCWLLILCDMTNVPDECKATECNCHNDCPPCQQCNSSGVCEATTGTPGC